MILCHKDRQFPRTDKKGSNANYQKLFMKLFWFMTNSRKFILNRAKLKWVFGFLARLAQNPALTPRSLWFAVPNRAKRSGTTLPETVNFSQTKLKKKTTKTTDNNLNNNYCQSCPKLSLLFTLLSRREATLPLLILYLCTVDPWLFQKSGNDAVKIMGFSYLCRIKESQPPHGATRFSY